MRSLLTLIALIIWCGTGQLRAGISAPISFARLSTDESRILVIRHDGEGDSESRVKNPILSNGEEVDFLSIFASSGVFSWPERVLIYEIDWFCLDRELLASDDLSHLARLNRFGDDWALKFYSAGQETLSYSLEKLLTAFKGEHYRPFVTWDYFHPWSKSFERRGRLVFLTTVNRGFSRVPVEYHEIHTFDIETGTLVKTDVRNGRFIALIVGLGGFSLILLIKVVPVVWTGLNKSVTDSGDGVTGSSRSG